MEAEKWIGVLERWGYEVHRVAGFIPGAGVNDHIIPELNFRDPVIESFTTSAFSTRREEAEVERELGSLTGLIGEQLAPVLDGIAPDLMVVENLFSLPVNMPLTLALCRYVEEREPPVAAVHHVFYWQSPAFSSYCVFDDLLVSHFPPSLPRVRHVTISQASREELYQKTAVTSNCLYYCFDFDNVRGQDGFNAGLRRDLGVGESEAMFLQPPCTIGKEGTKQSVKFTREFAAAAGRRSHLVVTGCGEGDREKIDHLRRAAGVSVIHVPGWLGRKRDEPGMGFPYDIHDAYARCDMVTFPSMKEGFGHPIMESVLHKKPLLTSNYPLLEELRGFGFQFLPMDRQAAARTVKLLDHPQLMDEMTGRNFEIGRRYFSLEALEEELEGLLSGLIGSPVK